MSTPTITTEAAAVSDSYDATLRSIDPRAEGRRQVAGLRHELARVHAESVALEKRAQGRPMTAREARQAAILKADHAAVSADLDRLGKRHQEVRDLSLRGALVHALDLGQDEAAVYALRSPVTEGVEVRNQLTTNATQGATLVPSPSSVLSEMVSAVAGHDGAFVQAVREVVVSLPPLSNSIDLVTLDSIDAVDVVAEGAPIAADLAAFGRARATLQKRSGITRISRELIEDSVLDAERVIIDAHGRAHARAAELDLFTTASTTAGILTSAPASVRLAQLQAAYASVVNAGHVPDLAVMSPADYTATRTALGIEAGRIAEAVGVAQVIPCSALPIGRALVLDSRHLVRVRRNVSTVAIGRFGPNTFDRDQVAVRSTVRAGAVVTAPTAVHLVAVP